MLQLFFSKNVRACQYKTQHVKDKVTFKIKGTIPVSPSSNAYCLQICIVLKQQVT
jgi:hypothetical protein